MNIDDSCPIDSYFVFRPGDNPNQCALGYGCPPYTMFLDKYVPFNSRFIDVGAGGPTPFTFTATSNESWLTLTPNKGSVSPSNPELRVEATVDWSKVQGSQMATINFVATASGQMPLNVPVFFVANHTVAPSGFHGIFILRRLASRADYFEQDS